MKPFKKKQTILRFNGFFFFTKKPFSTMDVSVTPNRLLYCSDRKMGSQAARVNDDAGVVWNREQTSNRIAEHDDGGNKSKAETINITYWSIYHTEKGGHGFENVRGVFVENKS